jgi:hypothetical protein
VIIKYRKEVDFNIFYLSDDPLQAAKWQCDQHVTKMPVETGQMLITARVLNGELREDTPYFTPRMKNHPCSIWVRECPGAFMYAQDMLAYLAEEYTYRYGRIHKTYEFYFSEIGALECSRERTLPVPLCVKDYPRWEGDPIKTYRHFYCADKRFARWRYSEPPSWWTRNEHG